MDEFLKEIWAGLTANPKYLPSKYFYDKTGDELFVQIMDCPEYYLTRCELEIFTKQGGDMAIAIQDRLKTFDVVELGAGDCTKSKHLLKALLAQDTDFTYYPIDISANVISNLEEQLPQELQGLKVQGLNGEYFAMLESLGTLSARNKVVLFLGSNIGNIPIDDTTGFLKQLGSYLAPGDLLLTGFDLKKDPAVILAAYNDKGGITRRFNLNLLQRINDTFGADLNLAQFEHLPVYDEQTGACKSYLVSNKDQQSHIGNAGSVTFGAGERILMEISQKYTAAQTDAFAIATGFAPTAYFTDSKGWFLDALWITM